MTQISQPINGVNFTTGQWRSTFSRLRGVLNGMALTRSPVTDDVTIAAGQALFEGQLYTITGTEVRNLPAVSTPKTYTVGLLYTPADEGNAATGPLKLFAAVKGTFSLPAGGGAYLPLWEIDRTNGVTLANSQIRNYSVRTGAVVYSPDGVSEPDPAGYGIGSILLSDSYIRVHNGTKWVQIVSDTGWRTDGFTFLTGFGNIDCRWRVINGVGFVNLDIRRTSGTPAVSNAAGELIEYALCTIPSPCVPSSITWRTPGEVHLSTGESLGGYSILPESSGAPGQVTMRYAAANRTIGPNARYVITTSYPVA